MKTTNAQGSKYWTAESHVYSAYIQNISLPQVVSGISNAVDITGLVNIFPVLNEEPFDRDHTFDVARENDNLRQYRSFHNTTYC